MKAFWISWIYRRNTATDHSSSTINGCINKVWCHFIKCPITQDPAVNKWPKRWRRLPSHYHQITKERAYSRSYQSINERKWRYLSCGVVWENSRQDCSSSFQSRCMPIGSLPYRRVKAFSALEASRLWSANTSNCIIKYIKPA